MRSEFTPKQPGAFNVERFKPKFCPSSERRALAVGSRAAQSEVDDFRRRVDPDRKPVANAIGYDHLTASARVKSRPVAEKRGTHTVLTVKHDFPAVRVAGQRQRQVRLDRGVEGMRMMCQQNGEGIRLALLQNMAHL